MRNEIPGVQQVKKNVEFSKMEKDGNGDDQTYKVTLNKCENDIDRWNDWIDKTVAYIYG